jgi:hypothetical protein
MRVTNCWHFDISETPVVTKPGASPPNVTKAQSEENYIAMYLAVKHLAAEPRVAMSWIDRDIRDFLAGENEGGDLLHALYDHVLDEPVPERLTALFKR